MEVTWLGSEPVVVESFSPAMLGDVNLCRVGEGWVILGVVGLEM